MHFFPEKRDDIKRELIEEIFTEKYDQYYRLAYSYVHHDADAGDIVQNAAYKAIKHCDTLKHPEYAESWVYRIVLNECFQYLKHPKFVSLEAMEEENGLDAVCQEDHYFDIDLQRALEALSNKDRAVIVLKYFEDKTLDDIARILGENINTIKSRLYRSLKKLQSSISNG